MTPTANPARGHGRWLDVTGLLNLTGWPCGMRVIVRRERPHPGAQLRLVDGHRLAAFATNTPPGGPGRQLLPIWNCATAVELAPRTGSGSRRTPD